MLLSMHASAQHIVTGTVRSGKTNEVLSGATIAVSGTKKFGLTDEFGRFRITSLQPGEYTLEVRYVGFESKVEQITVPVASPLTIELTESSILTDEVIVYATRANDNTPTTFSSLDRQTIKKHNFGQDLPYLLNWSPSLVTTSDAGTGFGYTGLRIRGSDATAINVTINGVPYNDSESLGTFWVDIPDIASSSQSIQIQRGVGTSTNGAGAFGASINLQTTGRNDEAYAEVVNSVGFLGPDKNQDLEYNSRRHTISFGTGLLANHWIIDGRISKINSEGFIDRANADMSSYYFAAGFYAGKTVIKGLAFGGKERTYQAWYGVPESRLKGDEEAMLVTAGNEGWNDSQIENLLNSSNRTFNPYTYKNQVDDYKQDNYQLHISQTLTDRLTATASLHYTPGKGHFEEYKYDDDFSDYGLAPVVIGDSTIESSDIIRRRWLDNDFYGATYSLSYDNTQTQFTFGGGWNRYDGGHYGQLIWSEVAQVPHEYRYYENNSKKTDFNIYAKVNTALSAKLNGYADVQYRRIGYSASGFEDEGQLIDVRETFSFFNPKAGIVWRVAEGSQAYGSFSIAHREPVRSDFVDAPDNSKPKAERLANLEAGYRFQKNKFQLNANYYLMMYKDQLVHTGKLNNSGASIRTNADKSYRTGIELEGLLQISPKWIVNGNVTFSQNKILDFTEVVYDYGANWDEYNAIERHHADTDIAFSPSVISGVGITHRPVQGLELSLLSKYVGRQYLDNTSNKNRSLDPYFVNDFRVVYALQPEFLKNITLSLMVNNIFSEEYESNGYTWGYLGGGEEFRENYYFPQAGRNFLLMVSMRF